MAIAADARDRSEPRPWGAMGAAFVSVLLFATIVFAPVASFPLAIQRLRGVAPGLATVGASLILIAALFGLGQAVSFGLFFAAPAWLMGEAMVRGHGLRRGCIWAFVLLGVELAIVFLLAGPNLAEQLRQTVLAQYSAGASAPLPSFLSAGPQDLADVKQIANQLAVVYPAVFLSLAGVAVLINGAVVRAYLVRRDPAWLAGGEFENLRWPFGFAVAFVLSGLGALSPPLQPVAYNILFVIAFLLTLQGLAIVLYYAHRLAGPALLRAALVVSVILWVPQLLGLLGLFDLWFDFRRFADVPPPEGSK
jgi:Predicted membrane protein (DUF2232)